MRSLSPIVAIVVLLLMTIAAAGMAYLTIVSYQSQSQAGSQGGLETLSASTKTQLKIESVSGGKIYLRNLGTETFENPNFYVGGQPLEVSGPDECQPGKICVYEVQEEVECTGDCKLSMGEDMPVGTKITVDEEDLKMELPPGPPILNLEDSVEWDIGGASTEGYTVVAGDIPGGSRKIFTLAYSGTCQLSAWNITNNQLTMENKTEWACNSPSFGWHHQLSLGELDSGIKLVTVMNGAGYNLQVRVWNYTDHRFNLEKQLSYTFGPGPCSVDIGDVDHDGVKEIVMSATSGATMPFFSGVWVYNYTDFELLEDGGASCGPSGAMANIAVNSRVMDIDSDNYPEILSLEDHDSVRYFCIPGDTTTTGTDKDIAAGNLGSDPEIRIVTYGGDIKVWNRTGGTLNLENTTSTVYTGNAVYVSDVDGDGTKEIVAVGNYLTIWNYTSGNLLLENATDLSATGKSIFIYDFNSDGVLDIITLSSTGSKAKLDIWNYTST